MATNNPDIAQANEALERLSQDPTARFLAQWREDQLRLLQVERAEVRRLGREEGREEALRAAIEALAEVLAIELPPPRRATLAAMRGAELTALLEHLRRERGWPSERPPGT